MAGCFGCLTGDLAEFKGIFRAIPDGTALAWGSADQSRSHRFAVPLDALIKKYFLAVVLILVAIAAYFQASGATELLGAALGVDEAALAAAPPQALASGAAVHRIVGGERKDAEPIRSRNPFDSVTGPLNAQPLAAPTLPAGQVDLSDPLGAPTCDGVQLRIVTESTDPEWSFAALQGPGEPGPKLRRIGDDVGGKEIAFIGFNPRENTPAVWLMNGPALCQALLFRTQPPAAPAAAASPPPPQPGAPPGGPSPAPADIVSKIQRVSANEFNVDRSVVDKILENQAELMKSARIVPEQKDGKVVGIRLFGIRPDTLLGTLGFENGDRLEAINGFNMASPEKALEAYARLRTASSLNVKLNRRGQATSLDYNIK
jgi:general secretion pathway protein C